MQKVTKNQPMKIIHMHWYIDLYLNIKIKGFFPNCHTMSTSAVRAKIAHYEFSFTLKPAKQNPMLPNTSGLHTPKIQAIPRLSKTREHPSRKLWPLKCNKWRRLSVLKSKQRPKMRVCYNFYSC